MATGMSIFERMELPFRDNQQSAAMPRVCYFAGSSYRYSMVVSLGFIEIA